MTAPGLTCVALAAVAALTCLAAPGRGAPTTAPTAAAAGGPGTAGPGTEAAAAIAVTGGATGPSSAPATAPAAATQTHLEPRESRLGPIRFTAPPGWWPRSNTAREAIALVAPDMRADKLATIVVLLTKPAPGAFDFRARFNKAVENTAAGHSITERKELVSDQGPRGYETLAQEFAFRTAPDDVVYGKLVATRVGDRLAVFCYLAAGRELYDKHLGDLAQLLKSVSFEAAGAAPPAAPTTKATHPAAASTSRTRPAPGSPEPPEPISHPSPIPRPAPASSPSTLPDLSAIEREKAELRKRLADLEAKERQIGAAFGAASGAAGTSTTAPAGSPAVAAAGPAEAAKRAGALDVIDRGRPGALLRDRYPKRTRLVLTLTPAGAAGAAAGSAETRSLTCDLDALAGGAHFNWLPPAPFKVTAKAVTPDAREWPLKLTSATAPNPADWSGSVVADLGAHPTIGITDVPH